MVLLQNPNYGGEDSLDAHSLSEEPDSTCSIPFVGAPSSPRRVLPSANEGYFFSAPASPVHFVLSLSRYQSTYSSVSTPSDGSSSEFEFSSRFQYNGSENVGSMSSADELFLNGRIRPMKLSSHLQRPQILAPLMDLEIEEDPEENRNEIELVPVSRGRDLKIRSKSLRRKARSLSPLRSAEFQLRTEVCNGGVRACNDKEAVLETQDCKGNESASTETTPSCSASSSRSSSSGRNSKKWIFLKDLLHRSKSEGRGNGKEKFWYSISFSPSKEKKVINTGVGEEKPHSPLASAMESLKQNKNEQFSGKKPVYGKPANDVGKRRMPPSAHELHYKTNRAQAEEMKKRTFLPYRQGLLGCLGFNSKGYGALSGLTESLNPVSSR